VHTVKDSLEHDPGEDELRVAIRKALGELADTTSSIRLMILAS
jgi:hypothetical protein